MIEAQPEIDVEEMIDAAIAETPQTLFAAAGVPLSRTDELLTAIQGPAVRAVIEARVEQIVKHGHDREYDAALALGHLPRVAHSMILDALDLVDGSAGRRNLPVAKRRLARVAAVCLAAIDRLDMALSTEARS